MVSIRFPGRNEGVAVLVRLDRCIGCRACQTACKEWNGLEYSPTEFSPTFTNPQDLQANAWKVVFFSEITREYPTGFADPFIQPVPFNCVHCAEAPCARACPVGAIKVTGEGAVVIEGSECIGCGYCLNACPYDVPRRREDGTYTKCTFCVDRIQNGLEPACVAVCPTDVFEFGPASQVIASAEQERAAGKVVYGLDVDRYVGGSIRWIYSVSQDRAAALNIRLPERSSVLPNFLREVLNPVIKYGALVGALALAALGMIHEFKYRRERAKKLQEKGGG